MIANHPRFGRRLFLGSASGIALGLPLLESVSSAADAAAAPFLAIISSANGVVQARPGETEAWWPSKQGILTKDALTADKATRAIGELADYADKLLLVKGIEHALGANGCNHASACAQLLTATATLNGNSNQTTANAESLDTVVAKKINPVGVDPFFLHAGMYQAGGSGFNVPSYISYIGPKQQRTAIDSPFKAYQKVTGGKTQAPTGGAQDPLALRRKSVNDVLRSQIQALQARTELTAEDRQRLDQHFTSIRELEIKISDATLSMEQVTQMQSVEGKLYAGENRETIQQLHMDLMVFALSSGYTKVAMLQVGDREDDHEYTLGGVKTQFHTASHRTLPNSYELCKQVDRIQIKHFKYFLDKMASTMTTTGPLLDQGVTVNTNQLGTGPDHSMKNMPYAIVGAAGGPLARGKFVDVAGTQSATFLNTLAFAVGVEAKMGGKSGNVSAILA